MLSRVLSAICCLCLGDAQAEPSTGAIPSWEGTLERESATAGMGVGPAEACHAAVQAADKLRQAQAAYGRECIYLYADYYRPEQEVVDNMLAAFQKQVDECLLQDLRTIITYSPWCRQGDRGGFWLRKPADAALWLGEGIPVQQPRTPTLMFTGRNRGAAATMALAGGKACDLQLGMVKLCAREIAGLYSGDMVFEPLVGTEPARGAIPPEDIQHAGAAFEEAEQAWEDYCAALVQLTRYGAGAAGDFYAQRVLERLCASHMQYLTYISNGIQSARNLRPEHGVFQVDAGQQRHPFGEIFHDYALFFRHPSLPGNPWCMTMSGPSAPDAQFTYVAVPPCHELDDYAAAHPEGGMVFVHGYFDVEVTGKPYEPINRPADGNGVIPDPRPADAYTIRPVLRVISLMPLKW